jgi:hypothetical protein
MGLERRRKAVDAIFMTEKAKGELLFEPGFERQHQRFALFLPHCAAVAGAAAPDRSDALESLAGDRSRAALGDVKEPAP